MGMFVVEAGTKARCIKDGKDWVAKNLIDFVSKKTNVFGKEQLVIDPTGISRHACVPHGVTIGSAYAKAGWYGFAKDGWTMLVPVSGVLYG